MTKREKVLTCAKLFSLLVLTGLLFSVCPANTAEAGVYMTWEQTLLSSSETSFTIKTTATAATAGKYSMYWYGVEDITDNTWVVDETVLEDPNFNKSGAKFFTLTCTPSRNLIAGHLYQYKVGFFFNNEWYYCEPYLLRLPDYTSPEISIYTPSWVGYWGFKIPFSVRDNGKVSKINCSVLNSLGQSWNDVDYVVETEGYSTALGCYVMTGYVHISSLEDDLVGETPERDCEYMLHITAFDSRSNSSDAVSPDGNRAYVSSGLPIVNSADVLSVDSLLMTLRLKGQRVSWDNGYALQAFRVLTYPMGEDPESTGIETWVNLTDLPYDSDGCIEAEVEINHAQLELTGSHTLGVTVWAMDDCAMLSGEPMTINVPIDGDPPVLSAFSAWVDDDGMLNLVCDVSDESDIVDAYFEFFTPMGDYNWTDAIYSNGRMTAQIPFASVGFGPLDGDNEHGLVYVQPAAMDSFRNAGWGKEFLVHNSYTSVLRIPGSAAVIEAEAFAGTAVCEVQIANGCASIASRAFADCESLRYVTIPASVAFIADDAFDGDSLIFLCPKDSAARTYADEHDLLWFDPNAIIW